MNYLPYNASLPLFDILRRIDHEFSVRPPICDGLAVVQGLLTLHSVAEKEQAKESIVHGMVLAICPPYANGLGDSVIWPELRIKALHREAELLTQLTNELRGML